MILIAAVRPPEAVGVNVTLIVQVPAAATVPPHELVWAKSAAFMPVTEMPVISKLVLPGLVMVIL